VFTLTAAVTLRSVDVPATFSAAYITVWTKHNALAFLGQMWLTMPVQTDVSQHLRRFVEGADPFDWQPLL
jgi:hypothetical protein